VSPPPLRAAQLFLFGPARGAQPQTRNLSIMRLFSGRLSLKTRFMIATGMVLLVLMTVIIILVGRSFTRSVREEVQARGLAVPAASPPSPPMPSHIQLRGLGAERRSSQSRSRSRVRGHPQQGTDGGRLQRPWWVQGKYLDDPLNERALGATAPSFNRKHGRKQASESWISPSRVYIRLASEMGTVRVGLSSSACIARFADQAALMESGAGTPLGACGRTFHAGRITQPLARVVEATIAAPMGLSTNTWTFAPGTSRGACQEFQRHDQGDRWSAT